jgi:hypothetical protein
MIQVTIESNDITCFPCDALLLKYAQAFHGADAIVAAALIQRGHGEVEINPKPGVHVLLVSRGAVAADHVLFVGVVPLFAFEYSEIRAFATRALTSISDELPDARHVAMTIHGVNYGLDEREAFLAQLGGIMDADKNGVSVECVSIVEQNLGRADRLKSILRETWPQRRTPTQTAIQPRATQRITAGADSLGKPHVFVAMPFSKELEDVYVFGIQGQVNAAGYLCERVDMATFTGDILERIKSRIASAALVVADLTGANPNVYLEVGYAWGKNRPTLLLLKKGDDLKFDVRGQRCIMYENIVDLSRKVQAEIAGLEEQGQAAKRDLG